MDDTREGLHSIPIVQITLKTLLKADDILALFCRCSIGRYHLVWASIPGGEILQCNLLTRRRLC